MCIIGSGQCDRPAASRGLASPSPVPYLPVMQFFRRFSPLHAFRDLRFFLSQREPRDLGFLVAAMAVTGFFVYAFMRNDIPPEPYQPNIIYFKNYAANRTDAQIKAQQAIDKVEQDQRIASQKAREEKLRSQFKTVDDAMNKWGL
jgi:hypothetical protein